MKDLARKYIDTEEREGRPFVNFQISRPNWFKSLSFSTCVSHSDFILYCAKVMESL